MDSILKFIGVKINLLTIIEDMGLAADNNRMVRCLCDCGNEKICRLVSIKSGRTKSCGCYKISRLTKHGTATHPLYEVWQNMIKRCYNKKCNQYHNYGGRGVTVCDEWRSDVKVFYEWALQNGWGKGLQLDKDKLAQNKTGKLYCPEYCCFLSREENTKHREISVMIEYNGVSMCLTEWVKKLGISYGALQSRLYRGWKIEDIINTPLQSQYSHNKKVA